MMSSAPSDRDFANTAWSRPGKLYLQPGELYVGAGYPLIQTLLGSCVAVCASHSVSGHLAICHLVLPGGQGKVAADYRFANHSLPVLYRAVTQLAPAQHWQWRLFGGASISGERDYFAVGQQNLAAVAAFASKHQIRFCHSDTGGQQGRIIQLRQDGSFSLQYCGPSI
ncbi:MAG TPA: hypothetical protein DF774_01570 [Rheinheimera sp.]|uniref:chemotaxis protein CheD n=1 Tax=Rheinheimera sp. TaxID=1869214 RepID=UPI000EBA8431|nr:chemotaxis protein CheD [Rheinheimera sp.]HCU64428.1 hypothetical protein [Rheinheimera sp.]